MSSRVFNCLIVDDEPLARDVIKRYIQKIPMLNLGGECGNAMQVMPLLHSQWIDIVFLDIRMPQLNGLDLVSTLSNPPKIIFTTAYQEYALQSYDLNAVDYLLKPIRFERFVKAVNKAVGSPSMESPYAVVNAATKESDSFLYFRADRKMVKVVLNDILYIESLKDYVKIVQEKGHVITKYSMAALEAMLPSSGFLRIHRSFIISNKRMLSYTASHVQLPGVELPIGKLYQREVLKLLAAN